MSTSTETTQDHGDETPIPSTGPVDISPIELTPAQGDDLDPIWRAVLPETRSRSNDVHLPMSLAYAERLCRAIPEADALVVRVSVLLHDTGWGRVDQDKLISEGFAGDWRRADIRYEHERQGVLIAREVLPPLGYDEDFIERVTAIIDGHDTRQEAHSLEDALMRDADRLWRFNHTGIALAHGWFGITPSQYIERLDDEILPELRTQAGIAIAEAELEHSRRLFKTEVL